MSQLGRHATGAVSVHVVASRGEAVASPARAISSSTGAVDR